MELVGEVGGKLHTARSRNDQVATAVRLWLKRRLAEARRSAVRYSSRHCSTGSKPTARTLMPGYTHLQRGQPVLLGHHLLAHAWALTRDRERLATALDRVDRSPLGACAMAGTGHPIDRESTAQPSAFPGSSVNAMDAVSARDHLQEVAAVCAIAWATCRAWPRSWSCGHRPSSTSSASERPTPPARASCRRSATRTPPSSSEARRGGSSATSRPLLVLIKGLPLAYNRDLQEDRAPLIDALDPARVPRVRIMAAMWRDLDVHNRSIRGGAPRRFQPGHRARRPPGGEAASPSGRPTKPSARAVRWCEEQGGDLSLLDGGTARQFHESFPEDLGKWLDPRAAVDRKTSLGGTAWPEIQRQLDQLRESMTAE